MPHIVAERSSTMCFSILEWDGSEGIAVQQADRTVRQHDSVSAPKAHHKSTNVAWRVNGIISKEQQELLECDRRCQAWTKNSTVAH